jgi:hypothetical protein
MPRMFEWLWRLIGMIAVYAIRLGLSELTLPPPHGHPARRRIQLGARSMETEFSFLAHL